MNVGVVLMNSTTIKVNWAAVNKETVRGNLMGYKVLLLYLICSFIFSPCPLESYIFEVYSQGSQTLAWQGVLFSVKVVMRKAFFILEDLTFRMYHTAVTCFAFSLLGL